MENNQTSPPTDVIRRPHDTDPSEGDTGEIGGEPAHHARRPMNAFLIFCKRHRSVVRDKYPSLENRSITKILGEWWANLEKEEKASYTGLAKQYKDAFFNANPDFKWYKLPAPPLRTLTRPADTTQSKLEDAFTNERKNNNSTQIDFNRHQNITNISPSEDSRQSSMITLGKLANEAHMGGLNSLMHHFNQSSEITTSDYGDDSIISVPPAVKLQPCETFVPTRSEVYSIRAKTDNLNNHVCANGQGSKVRMKTKDMTSESNIKLQDELSETTRIFEKTFEMSVGVAISHNLIKRDTNINNNYSGSGLQEVDRNSNFTPQQLINQVVDRKLSTKEYTAGYDESADEITFSDANYGPNISTSAFTTECDNQSRSGRSCKGKRYQEFMAVGGLKVNKRQRPDYGRYRFDEGYTEHPMEHNPSGSWAEVSGSSGETDPINREIPNNTDFYTKSYYEEGDIPDQSMGSAEHGSEQSFADNNGNKMFKASDFDLDAKIRALPSLSLEKFQQKKRDNKKRKRCISLKSKEYRPKLIEKSARRPSNGADSSQNVWYSRNDFETQFNHNQVERNVCNQTMSVTSPQAIKSNKMQIAEQWREAIIGSQKRKPRKISITRLAINSTVDKTDVTREIGDYRIDSVTARAREPKHICEPVSQPESQPQLDLFALATLAEIASNTSKLDETK